MPSWATSGEKNGTSCHDPFVKSRSPRNRTTLSSWLPFHLKIAARTRPTPSREPWLGDTEPIPVRVDVSLCRSRRYGYITESPGLRRFYHLWCPDAPFGGVRSACTVEHAPFTVSRKATILQLVVSRQPSAFFLPEAVSHDTGKFSLNYSRLRTQTKFTYGSPGSLETEN